MNCDDFERVLQLAKVARDAANSPQWKTNTGDAVDLHGEACENLWEELYRLLDNRAAAGDPVLKPRMPPDPRKELRKQIVARLREELPSMVESIISEF